MIYQIDDISGYINETSVSDQVAAPDLHLLRARNSAWSAAVTLLRTQGRWLA